MYDKDGNLITEINDNGKNMGTYNYASSSKDSDTHTKYDVDTYENWGNTPLDPTPIKGSWNDNVTKKKKGDSKSYNEPCIKENQKPDEEAIEYYKDICEDIGIGYYKLLKNNYSDACY